MTEERYLVPDRFTQRVFNPTVQFLTRCGISIMGSRVLRVRGRKSGEWRSTPVNLLRLDGDRYLVAPRGTTQWVRNMRVAGGGELRVGRRRESFRASEVADEDKVPVLRRVPAQVGLGGRSVLRGRRQELVRRKLREIAPGFPVFTVRPA